MERDFGIRFSDEVYATKDEVKRTLSISNVDSIWEKISQYRSFYKRDLELFSIERKPFSVCLMPSIQSKIISLEKSLVKLMVSFERMNNDERLNFLTNNLMIVGKSYAKANSLTITDDELRKIINNPVMEVPQAFLSLKNYISTLQYYLYKSAKVYDISVFTSFYGKILRKDIDPFDYESYSRLIDLNNPSDHMMFGRHYNAAPLEKLEGLLNDIMSFNSSSRLFTLVKSIITYFYLIYIKPFDYFNEECALLSLKYIIANDDVEVIPFLINLEKYLLNSDSEEISKKFILSELSLDLTYYLNYVLDIIQTEINNIYESIQNDEIRQIKEEFSQVDRDIKREHIAPQVISNYSHPNNNPIVFEQKVSMPKLPTGLDEKDIDLIAENLLELFPSLKKLQAKFYAGHCTIGKYYSIAQYKKETGVAYETARTSMDNLVQLGFYKKEQIKNKYVYTPVVR